MDIPREVVELSGVLEKSLQFLFFLLNLLGLGILAYWEELFVGQLTPKKSWILSIDVYFLY